MFTAESSRELSAPLPRAWSTLVDLDNFGRWHGVVAIRTDPGDSRKIFVSSLRHPRFCVDAEIVKLAPENTFAWCLAMKPFVAWREEFLLTSSSSGTFLTHRVEISGLLSGVIAFFAKRKVRQSLENTNHSFARYLARQGARPKGERGRKQRTTN